MVIKQENLSPINEKTEVAKLGLKRYTFLDKFFSPVVTKIYNIGR